MSRNTARWWPALGLLLVLALASCAQKTEPTTSTSTSTEQTQATAPVSVVAVDLGRTIDADKQVTERIEVFKPNDTIYASIRTSGGSPDSKLAVKWMDEKGMVVDQSEQTIAGATATEFHIMKPEGLPPGDYKVEILVDGSTVQTKDFKVSAG